MTIRKVTYEVYTIEDHPNKEACYEWIRNNWHDLGEHVLGDMVASLKSFCEVIGTRLDYAIGVVPSRGEFVDIDADRTLEKVPELGLSGSCPFTGTYMDEVILDAFRNAEVGDTMSDIRRDIEHRVLKSIHADGEYLYSDEGLYDMCSANGYEFNVNGEVE